MPNANKRASGGTRSTSRTAESSTGHASKTATPRKRTPKRTRKRKRAIDVVLAAEERERKAASAREAARYGGEAGVPLEGEAARRRTRDRLGRLRNLLESMNATHTPVPVDFSASQQPPHLVGPVTTNSSPASPSATTTTTTAATTTTNTTAAIPTNTTTAASSFSTTESFRTRKRSALSASTSASATYSVSSSSSSALASSSASISSPPEENEEENEEEELSDVEWEDGTEAYLRAHQLDVVPVCTTALQATGELSPSPSLSTSLTPSPPLSSASSSSCSSSTTTPSPSPSAYVDHGVQFVEKHRKELNDVAVLREWIAVAGVSRAASLKRARWAMSHLDEEQRLQLLAKKINEGVLSRVNFAGCVEKAAKVTARARPPTLTKVGVCVCE
jgi:hypothetical protein